MIYELMGAHLIAAISWVVFLLLFIKSLDHESKDVYLFMGLSLVFMFAVLGIGTKIMLLNPAFAHSGNWLHVKLSIDIVLMIENIYLAYIALRKKVIPKRKLQIMFWVSYLLFMAMVFLTIFKPF